MSDAYDKAHDFLHGNGVEQLLRDVTKLKDESMEKIHIPDSLKRRTGPVPPQATPDQVAQVLERRVVNETTGGAKGSKLARFDLIPQGPLWTLAELYGIGARKYDERNWERGYAWSLSFAAMQRHANLFWKGEDVDPETGLPHMAAVAFHAFALMQFMHSHRELDDRSAE